MADVKCLLQLLLGALYLITTCTACTRCGTRPNLPRIINGREAFPHSWPWMAYLEIGRGNPCESSCGGSLIGDQWVLTAAHCLFTSENCPTQRQWRADEIQVSLGVHSRSRRATTAAVINRGVSKIYIINSYDPDTFDNDLAVLKLSDAVEYSDDVSPICPLRGEDSLVEGAQCTVTGWGTLSPGSRVPSDVLMEAQVSFSSAEACRANSRYKEDTITDDMVCAAGAGTDACSGDSGGPLVCSFTSNGETQWKQVGIVSFGKGCASPGFPGVYADVKKMSDFILRSVGLGLCGSMEKLDSTYYAFGPDIKYLRGVSERECEEACIDHGEDCRAATFRKNPPACWLHEIPRGTGGNSNWVAFRRRNGCF